MEPPESGIGRDEWVARKEALTLREGRLAGLQAVWERVPAVPRFAVAMGATALLPALTSSDYIVRVGLNTLIYALLALGLNIVVGWAGLLDLGYIAFYGFGAYAYALLSSDQFHIHWPTLASMPLIVIASALLGMLIALPSRRLLGDYLAILTLFFAQAFVTLVSNANRITPPGHKGPVDFTGGPNGISGVDNLHIGGLVAQTVRDYYYVTLVVFIVVVAALWSLNRSRTGRAWRSVREDPVASEAMGMPVKWLKLTAFAFGAAIAGLTGSIFAAVQVGVFPTNFDISLLITIYAMVILGGAGSMTGVVLGALTINVVLEVLRTPNPSRLVFYVVVLAALVASMRPYLRLAAVLAGTVVFGIAVHAVARALAPGATHGVPLGTGTLGRLTDHWVVLLTNPTTIGNIAYAFLLLSVALLTKIKGAWRAVLLVPTLYLAAFVWENRLVDNPSVTRLIVVGALLVALMNVRPQGLLGTARIEIA